MHNADSFAWPGYLDKHRIPEEAFAEAYTTVSDIERSWIKKNIAQLYALAPANARRQIIAASRWTVGFQSIIHVRPKDWVILFLAGKSSGPARSVAAILPAMTSGVNNILILSLDQTDLPPRLLVSLELCGLDMVCAVDEKRTRNLLALLTRSETRGLLLDPDHLFPSSCFPEDWQETMTLWQPVPLRRMGVWSEGPTQWDWQTLAWNHPDQTIDVWGKPPKKLSAGFRNVFGNKEAFYNAGYQAMGISSRFLEKASRFRCDLIFTPGQEGCWLWPELSREFFLTRKVCLETTCGQFEKPS